MAPVDKNKFEQQKGKGQRKAFPKIVWVSVSKEDAKEPTFVSVPTPNCSDGSQGPFGGPPPPPPPAAAAGIMIQQTGEAEQQELLDVEEQKVIIRKVLAASKPKKSVRIDIAGRIQKFRDFGKKLIEKKILE